MKCLLYITTAAVFSPVIALCDPPDFHIAAPRQFLAGEYPEVMVAADFNEDGMTDLATGDRIARVVVILLGDTSGVGSFAPGAACPVHGAPFGLTVADLNEDGILDIVSASRDSGTVSILLGNGAGGAGDGTFAPAAHYPAGGSCHSAAAGDFDGDGIPDLAVVNDQGFDDLRILTGQGAGGVGDGTFSAPGASLPLHEWPQKVIAVDPNEDGILDLIIAHAHADNLVVMIGNGAGGTGDGTFQPPVDCFVGRGAHDVIAADFDGDGVLDLAAPIWNFDYLAVLRGNGAAGVGDGTFQPMVSYPVPNEPRVVAAGDWNGDTVLDLATTAYGGAMLSVLVGVGDGTFLPAVEHDASGRAYSLAAGDFDGDGLLDVAALNPAMGSVLLFRGKGDGSLIAAAIAPTAGGSSAAAAADFDGDGAVDLVVADGGIGEVLVLAGDGGGLFTPVDSAATSRPCRDMVVDDFNGDHLPDVVATHFTGGTISVLAGNGDGTLGLPAIDTVGSNPGAIVSGDWNGDGIADLAFTLSLPPSIAIYAGNGAGGTGDGTFVPAGSYGAVGAPRDLALGDFNTDGIADLALASRTVDSVTVFLGGGVAGVGDGTFVEGARQGCGVDPASIAAGDLNGDGILDLATADEGGETVSILAGNGVAGVGDGTFAPPIFLGVPGDARHVTIADADGDLIPDLLVSLGGRGALAVLPGLGGGAFGDAILFAAGRKAILSVTGDFDESGMPDIAVIGQTTQRVRILLNRSEGIATTTGGEAPPPAATARLVNVPNPFNPATTFPLVLEKRSRVTLAVFSPSGRRIRLLADGVFPPGDHRIEWNGLDDSGRPQPSGLYLTRLRTNGRTSAGKALLVR